jgi:PAS domain-containing protein
MRDTDKAMIEPAPADLARLLPQAVDNLSLGIIIFDAKREVVFCNARYREIYRLSADQVRPGTPIRELIQHRLNLGLKVHATPEDYIRERVGRDVVEDSAVHEFVDGRIIAYRIHPMPDGGGMATHEDITAREELSRQFDTAINNMSQGLCFFDAQHRLLVCNDLYIDMYDLPRDRVGPGTTLSEIVDMRFEAGSFPEMSREEYLHWRTNVAVSAEAKDSIVELRNGKTFKIRHRPMPDLGWVATHEDITEQRQAEIKIEHMAHHDALTDLANRVLLSQRLEQALHHFGSDKMIAAHHLDSISPRPSTTRSATTPATSC